MYGWGIIFPEVMREQPSMNEFHCFSLILDVKLNACLAVSIRKCCDRQTRGATDELYDLEVPHLGGG